MGGLQHFQMGVVFARAIPFNDFMPDGIDKGVEILNLHGGNPIHINLNIRKKLDKVLMGDVYKRQIYKWAQEDAAKEKPKKGIPDYSFKEGESL